MFWPCKLTPSTDWSIFIFSGRLGLISTQATLCLHHRRKKAHISSFTDNDVSHRKMSAGMHDHIMLVLLKHQLLAHGQGRRQEGREQPETAAAFLPETRVLIDLCRKHYALVAKKGVQVSSSRNKRSRISAL